ncbi:MAG: recombinase family protein [Hyphomonas sp.]
MTQAEHRPLQKKRCAIYTRKSSEEGLEQDFNSLDAQREACEAYIVSQKSEGWILSDRFYDDGGFSGGTLDRPALKRLRADIEAGLVDVVVVYKIDRLTRAIHDFGKLVEVFEKHNVTFVSVTQSFNTTTSMGRLMMNVLLSFAQFEREVTGERIRDKIAASKRKGMWMGGHPPYGYFPKDRKLEVVEYEARNIRKIFHRFVDLGSATLVVREFRKEGLLTRAGKPFSKSFIYRALNNRTYLGQVEHNGQIHDGQHKAIISERIWDEAHLILAESPRKRAANTRAKTPALLKGIVFGPDGAAMSPHHTRKDQKLYRYYVSQTVLKHGAGSCPVGRVPAERVEALVIAQMRERLTANEFIVGTWRQARLMNADISEEYVRNALMGFEAMWDKLFPTEQSRILQLLVERVDVLEDQCDIQFRPGVPELLPSLMREEEDDPALL